MRHHHIQADDGPRWSSAEIGRHSFMPDCWCDPIVETVTNATGRQLLSIAHHPSTRGLLPQEKLCDKCAFPSRETVNMICQACGTDYSGQTGAR